MRYFQINFKVLKINLRQLRIVLPKTLFCCPKQRYVFRLCYLKLGRNQWIYFGKSAPLLWESYSIHKFILSMNLFLKFIPCILLIIQYLQHLREKIFYLWHETYQSHPIHFFFLNVIELYTSLAHFPIKALSWR